MMCLIHTVKLSGSFKSELGLFEFVSFDVHTEDLPLLDERLSHEHLCNWFYFDGRHHTGLINLYLRLLN